MSADIEIDDYAKKYPCVQSGYCCTVRPCPYGDVKSATDHSCRFLEEGDEIIPGVRRTKCGKYDWIKANVPERDWKMSPAFGGGCSSTLYNDQRDRIIIAERINAGAGNRTHSG